MEISVPSRFACLKIEDDDVTGKPAKNAKKSEVIANKKKLVKPNKPSNSTKEVITNNKTKRTSSNKQKLDKKQWEDWKMRDSAAVNDNFDKDLQNAILQSKLDYEANKNKQQASDLENARKKKKNKAMNLTEFLELQENPQQDSLTRRDPNFFQKMVEAAQKEVARGKVEEQRKERQANINNDVISIAHYQEKLKLEQERNLKLTQDLEEIKSELTTVKMRNTMLCNVLAHGEMKEKAEVLVELERLNAVKDELTMEVSRLHKLLEQERSKTADSFSVKSKDYKNKK